MLALTELDAELGDENSRSTLREGTLWLTSAPILNNQPLPGLYVGEAGVGAALLRAGLLLKDQQLLSTAIQYGRQVAVMPYVSPDLMTGAAGRLRFHLLLWDATGQPEHLQAATRCADYIIKVAMPRNTGEICWAVPDENGKLSQDIPLGYAHGAAGIADALLDLFEITLNEQLLVAVKGAAAWLKRQSVTILEDRSGINWPVAENQKTLSSVFWCHGATGIGRFFLHAAKYSIVEDALSYAQRAARSTSFASRWSNPTQCHGLAGNIEFLVDMYQATKGGVYLQEAVSLGDLLSTFSWEQDDLYVFPTDSLNNYTPDYMLGYSGVATCFLRLSDPASLPYLLSRSGFQSIKSVKE